MKYYSAKVSFINPVLAGVVFAIMLSVIIMLWYQSSRKIRGTNKGINILERNLFTDSIAMSALSKDGCKNDKYIQQYISKLKDSGYHKSALVWVKFADEQAKKSRRLKQDE